ncbi:MAG: histidine kinase [Chloroflexota bacterium]|jgi:signal transduction histidine kinase
MHDDDLLEILFDRVPMGLAIIDPDFKLVRYNPTWAGFVDRYTPSHASEVKPGASLFDLEPGVENVLRPLFAPVFAGETVHRQAVRLESEGTVSYWDVTLRPLMRDGRVVAALDVSLDATERVLAQEMLEERVAARTAELERRRRTAESLADILRVINSTQPLSQILNYIVDQARHLSAAQVCVLHRIDYVRAAVAIEATSGLPADLADIEEFPLFSSRSDELILEKRPVIIDDLHRLPPRLVNAEDGDLLDPDVRRWREGMRRRYAAFMAVPLVLQGEVYGSLAFYYREPRMFDPDEIAMATSLGDQASLAIDNARLRIRATQTAVAAERNRLARELHDAVTQTLFSASLIAEVLPRLWIRDPAQAAARLEELRELTRGALAEMRTLLLELRPAALIETDLEDLLNQLANGIIGRTRMPVTVEIEGSRCLNPDIQVALYRIAQESLNNVIKHAGATWVKIRLCLGEEAVELSITDDGRGFNMTEATLQSLGLNIMRERASRIGATLAITSAPGQGTSIEVFCPLNPIEEEVMDE